MKTYHENHIPWPVGKPRTSQNDRKWGLFQCGSAAAGAERVEESLMKLNGRRGRITEVWIYADAKLSSRNRFLANSRAADDPGVVVTFDLDGKQFSIAADIYKFPGQNLAGIAQYIEGIRTQERHQIVSGIDQLAFAALPSPGEVGGKRPWWVVLDIPASAAPDKIHAAYRSLVKVYHPDNPETGSHDRYIEIANAHKEALLDRGVTA